MAHSRKEKPTVDQVLKLADQLTMEERKQLMQELQVEDLRRELKIGIDEADRGELIPAEEVLDKLRKRAQSRL